MQSFHLPLWKAVSNSQSPPRSKSQMGKCQRLLPINKPKVYQSTKSPPPKAGSLTVSKTFHFHWLTGPSQLRWDDKHKSVIQSFNKCLLRTFCSQEGKQRDVQKWLTHASQTVGGTRDVLVIWISRMKQPWVVAPANVRGVNYSAMVNFKPPVCKIPEYLKICPWEPPD